MATYDSNVLVTLAEWASTVHVSVLSVDRRWRLQRDFPLPCACLQGSGPNKHLERHLYRRADLDAWYQQWQARYRRRTFELPGADRDEMVTLGGLARRLNVNVTALYHYRDLIKAHVEPELRGKREYFPLGAVLDALNTNPTGVGITDDPAGDQRRRENRHARFSLPDADPNELITIRELARRLGLSTTASTFNRYRDAVGERLEPEIRRGRQGRRAYFRLGSALEVFNAVRAEHTERTERESLPDLDIEAITAEYAEGDSPSTIAARHGVSATTISNRLTAAGVELRSHEAASALRGHVGDVDGLAAALDVPADRLRPLLRQYNFLPGADAILHGVLTADGQPPARGRSSGRNERRPGEVGPVGADRTSPGRLHHNHSEDLPRQRSRPFQAKASVDR